MFSVFSRIRRVFKTTEVPPRWFDPAALPGAPIIVFTAPSLHTCPNRKSVRWWNKDTPTVAGVFSPPLFQDKQLQGDSQPIFGFNIETGSSYLPDCSGDLSLDTIRCSTEEGGDIFGSTLSPLLSSSASIATLRSGNLSDYCSSNSSTSHISMVTADWDKEDSFYFSAAEFVGWPLQRYNLSTTALVLDSQGSLTTEEERKATEEAREEAIPFGNRFPPRRVSTITRLVGNAIRDRRSRSRVDDLFCTETSIKPYRCGLSRMYIPHTLTTIMEDRDEE